MFQTGNKLAHIVQDDFSVLQRHAVAWNDAQVLSTQDAYRPTIVALTGTGRMQQLQQSEWTTSNQH